MKVAIIGAGNVGKALATSISRAGHDVTISAKNPEHAHEAASGIAATAADSNAAAAVDADVVILAVPYGKAGAEVAAEIRDEVAGRTVIDVTNPLKSDYSGLATDTSAAEELQQQLPEANVVKAFNTIFASNQAQPTRDIDGYVAADDEKAKFKLSVGDEDYGRIIGKGGRTANALRTVVKAAAVKEQRRVLVDIVD